MSRLFGTMEDIAKTSSFKIFFDRALHHIPKGEPGNFNQAIMEYGATVCTPKTPKCEECLFNKQCFAKQNEMIDLLNNFIIF